MVPLSTPELHFSISLVNFWGSERGQLISSSVSSRILARYQDYSHSTNPQQKTFFVWVLPARRHFAIFKVPPVDKT